MKYGHVGRPTKQEVSNRKKKILIKILSPILLVAVIVAVMVHKGIISNLMGNSLEICKYSCEEGLKLCNISSTAYCCKETRTNEIYNAYILGDIDQNNTVSLEDYNLLKKLIASKVEIKEEELSIYDINRDQIFDEYDVQELFNIISNNENKVATFTYVCDEDVNAEEGITKTIVENDLVGSQCVRSTIIREGLYETSCNDENVKHQQSKSQKN